MIISTETSLYNNEHDQYIIALTFRTSNKNNKIIIDIYLLTQRNLTADNLNAKPQDINAY